MLYTLRSGLLKGFVNFLSDEYGLEAEPFLKRVGIKADVFDSDDVMMPVFPAIELLRLAVEETNDSNFGLKLAKAQDPEYLGLLGLIIRTSANMYGGIKTALRLTYFQPSGMNWELSTYGDHVILALRTVDFTEIDSRCLIDLFMLQADIVFLRISKNRCKPIQVCIQRASPECDAFYRKCFSARVTFNAEFNGFVFLKEDLLLPLPGIDRQVNEALTNYAEKLYVSESSDLVDSVKTLIRQFLPTGECKVESVAKLLAKDKRTLQRALKERGTGFVALREEVRFAMAEEYLAKTSISITQIAIMLGYKEVSSFSGAFKRSRGYSPLQWRKQDMKSKSLSIEN